MVLSVPSYVIPGTYLENLRFLEKHAAVRNVELLFFSWDEEARKLLKSELPEIKKFANRFSFTVHMPNLLAAETANLPDTCEDFVTHFIVHPPGPGQTLAEYAGLLENWRGRFGDKFLLENTTAGNFEAVQALFPKIPLCMDSGHLLLKDSSPAAFAKNNAFLIRQIHLHGIENGKDHAPFSLKDGWFRELVPYLRNFTGILELELFDWGSLSPLISMLQSELKIS